MTWRATTDHWLIFKYFLNILLNRLLRNNCMQKLKGSMRAQFFYPSLRCESVFVKELGGAKQISESKSPQIWQVSKCLITGCYKLRPPVISMDSESPSMGSDKIFSKPSWSSNRRLRSPSMGSEKYLQQTKLVMKLSVQVWAQFFSQTSLSSNQRSGKILTNHHRSE